LGKVKKADKGTKPQRVLIDLHMKVEGVLVERFDFVKSSFGHKNDSETIRQMINIAYDVRKGLPTTPAPADIR